MALWHVSYLSLCTQTLTWPAAQTRGQVALTSHAQSKSLYLQRHSRNKIFKALPPIFIFWGPKVIRKNCACVGREPGTEHIMNRKDQS